MITEAVTTDSPLCSTALKVKVVLQYSLEFPKSLSPSLYEMVIVLMSECAELKAVAFTPAFQMLSLISSPLSRVTVQFQVFPL